MFDLKFFILVKYIMNMKSTIEREKVYLLKKRNACNYRCDLEVYSLQLESIIRSDLLKREQARILFIYVENCAIYFGEYCFKKY